ncbi:hypothetical protein FRC10_004120, partial [Ceratobasidium sp. 414]
MSLPSLDVYGTEFAHWKHVQQQLTRSIQDYVDACATLKTALAVFPVDYPSRCKQAEAFASLDSQLPVLASYEQRLHDARFSLKITRSTSQSLIPINSLPLEMLDTIFILVVQQRIDAVCTLTTVCKLWRHITLQSPACWSRIELAIGPGDALADGHAELWAKRTQHEPLYISMREDLDGVEEPTCGDYGVARSVNYLTPLMPRVRAITFTDRIGLGHLVAELLICWVKHGTIGTAGILEIEVLGQPVTLETRHLAAPTVAMFKTFFGSLHTLSLENAKLDWKLGFYSGLVNLRISNEDDRASYSQWDITAILAASPRLRSLAIVGLNIDMDRRPDGVPSTVALNDLNALRPESSSYTRNLWTVLGMITSTSDSIGMSLSFANQDEFIPAARSFFERCKITALHISSECYQGRPLIPSLFTYTPHLKFLAIKNRSIFHKTWRESPLHNGSPSDPWPQLDEVFLINCNLDQEALSQLVYIHAPRILRVYGGS